MKKLLFEDTQSIDNETNNIKSETKVLNQLIEFWAEHRLGRLDPDMVRKFILNPEKVIYDIIKSRIPDVDPNTLLKNNKEKILEGLNLPHFDPDILRLIELVDRKGHLSLFDFGNDEVTLNQERITRYMDQHRHYSDDPKVLNAYDELNQLADQLNKFNKKMNIISLNLQTFGESDIFFNKLSKMYRIGAQGLKLTQSGFLELTAH